MKKILAGMILILGFLCGVSIADSVKLQNGSYFEGRILEDTGPSIKMQLGIGVVEFDKDEIVDMAHSSESQNREIERQWTRQEDPDTPDESSAQEDPVDKYMNKGKVKYQGRWISQEVHEVIQKEKEIKEKRYRFMQEQKQRLEKERQEEAQRRLAAAEEATEGEHITAPEGRMQAYHRFGKFGEVDEEEAERSSFKTRVVARKTSQDHDSSQHEASEKASSFGSFQSRPYAASAKNG